MEQDSNKKKQITISISEELINLLKEDADRKGYTVTDLINFILRSSCF